MGRDDREVVVVDRSEGGALKWLVVGAALGAGLALLFAPKAGKDLRRDLKKGIRRARELADDTIHEFRRERDGEDTTEERAVPAGAYVDEEDEDAEDEEPATAERPPRPSLVSAREELERRLAAARARRQAVAPEEEEPVA